MKLRASILLVVIATVTIAGFSFWDHDVEEPARVAELAAEQHTASASASAPALARSPVLAAEAAVPVSAQDVERWTTEATGGDAGKRAAAITALAQAPVAQALPILRRVLMNGESSADRPLALQSLRDLALNHGDPESAIRNAIREAIYHGDDQTMAADAQEALDVIEEGLMK